MYKTKILKFILLATLILMPHLSAFAENETNIINTYSGKSMIMNNIESINGIYTINKDIDSLESFAIKESKETEKLNKIFDNQNNDKVKIAPSVITPDRAVTLDDIIDDIEDNNTRVKVLTKEKPEM